MVSITVSITISSFAIILHSADAFFFFANSLGPPGSWLEAWVQHPDPVHQQGGSIRCKVGLYHGYAELGH